MGWGISFTGYASKVTKKEVDDRIEELKASIVYMKQQLIALAVMTPITKKSNEGFEIMPHEWIPQEVEELVDELEEMSGRLAILYQVKSDEKAEDDF